MVTSAKSFVGPLAGLFAVGAGVAFFKGAVNGASDLAESASKVTVVFGEQAGAIMKASKTSASAMGLSKSAYLAANGELGNLLVSLKIAPKDAANMSQQMVKLAGDMASFNNVSPEEALLAIRSGLTGETEPLKRFGVNMNDATLKTQALKLGLIKTTKEAMSPQTKALAAQALIMAQTGTAQGDFARTSGGLANQQRIAAAQTENLKNKIGKGLLPLVTAGTKAYAGFVKGIINGTGAGGKFRDILMSVGGAIKGAVGVIKSIVGFLTQHATAAKVLAIVIGTVLVPAIILWGVQSTVAAAKSVAAWIVSKAGAISSAAFQVVGLGLIAAGWVFVGVQSLLGAAKVALAWVIAMGPIGIVIALVVGLVIVIVKNWDTIMAATVAVWNAVSSAVVGAVRFVVNFVKAHWPLLLAIIAGPIGIAVLLVVKHWARIMSATSSAFKFVRSAVSSAVNAARSAVSSAVGGIVSIFRGLLGRIRGALSGAGGALVGVGRNIVNGLISGIRSMGGAIGRALVNLLPGPLKKFAGMLGIASPSKVFVGFGANIGQGLVLGINGSRASVEDSMSRLVSSVRMPAGAKFDVNSGASGATSAPTVDPIDYTRLAQEFAKITIRNNLSIGKRDAATLVTVGSPAARVLQ